jgi:Bardet-Biedl syndrome 2 protein
MQAYDLDADGVPEIVSGWSNGSFNVRKDYNGEVIFKSNMGGGGNARISALLSLDYRLDGKEELIVCSETGNVRGYLPISQEANDMYSANSDLNQRDEGDDGDAKTDLLSNDQKVLLELQSKKQDLMNELRLLEKGLKAAKDTNGKQLPTGTLPPGALTNWTYSVEPNVELESVCVRVETQAPQVVVVNLIAIDAGMFDASLHINLATINVVLFIEGLLLDGKDVASVSPSNPTNFAILPLKFSRNMEYTLRIQIHLAMRGFTATHLHVVEADIKIPKFASFNILNMSSNDASNVLNLAHYKEVSPQSSVSFKILEVPSKVSEWISSSFLSMQKTLNAGTSTSFTDKVKYLP